MKIVTTSWVIALSATLFLAGCQQQNKPQDTQASEQQQQNDSLNDYIFINNQLMGLNGLAAAASAYQRMDIAHAKATQALSFPSINFQQINKYYQSASNGKRQNPQLDTAVDDLMKKLQVLEQDHATFSQYYDSGAYKDDKLAKAKAADAAIRQHYADAVQSFTVFQKELDSVYRASKKAELERIKASGDQYQYHRAYAMQLAEELVNIFQNPQDLKNTSKLQHADAIAKQLQVELDAINVEYQKVKQKNPNANADTVLMSLNSCLKYYRQARQSNSPYDFKFMQDGYNSAVQSWN